jgi:GR25 family glycosyltransferase involved in LPS biosynthesis
MYSKRLTEKSLVLIIQVKYQGFLGCLDSHRRLFQMAEDNDIETLLVMEDDIEVDQNFQ